MHLRKTAPTTVGLYHQLAQPRVALVRMLPAPSSALPALTRSHALSCALMHACACSSDSSFTLGTPVALLPPPPVRYFSSILFLLAGPGASG